MKARGRHLIAGFIALSLVTAACGGDDDSADAPAVEPAAGASADEPVDDSADEPADDSGDEPADDSGDEPADDSGDEPWEITVAVVAEMGRIDPQSGHDIWTRYATMSGVSEGLYTYSPSGELVPVLAESFELIGDSTYRYHLREGITFSNGEPFNAEAVKFSLERHASEEFASSSRGFVTPPFESAEVVDEYTIDVNLSSPFPDWPIKAPYSMVVPPGYTEDMSVDGPNEQLPVGTGPYVMVSRNTDEVVLEKRDDYWGGEVGGPDRIRLIARPEMSTALAAFQAGEVDFVPSASPDWIGQVEQISARPPISKFTLQMNASQPPLNDVRIREAILKAIDFEGLRVAFMGEEASAPGLCQYANEGTYGFTPTLENAPFDPDAAQALVAEAGADGLTLSMVIPAETYPNVEPAAQVMLEQLADVGITVDLTVTDFQSYLDAILVAPEERPNLFIINSSSDTGVTQAWSTYVRDGSALESMPYEENPELLELVEAALTELDPDARVALIDEANVAICEANTTGFVWGPNTLDAHQPDLVLPDRTNPFWNWTELGHA